MPETPTRSPRTSHLRPERLGQHEPLRPERLGEPLTAAEVEMSLRAVPGWQIGADARCLERTYSFPTLRAAVAFVALVTEVGEANGYVPEIDERLLEVTVRIETHVAPGLAALDFQVARSMEGL